MTALPPLFSVRAAQVPEPNILPRVTLVPVVSVIVGSRFGPLMIVPDPNKLPDVAVPDPNPPPPAVVCVDEAEPRKMSELFVVDPSSRIGRVGAEQPARSKSADAEIQAR